MSEVRPPKKAARVEQVRLEIERLSEQHALCCVYEGNRYHVWLDAATLELKDTALYKNPPEALGPTDPGYFSSRRLSTESNFGRWIVQTMREVMTQQKLLEKALAKRAEEEEAKRARAIADLRSAKESAAEALFDLVKEFADRFSGQVPGLERRARKVLNDIERAATNR